MRTKWSRGGRRKKENEVIWDSFMRLRVLYNGWMRVFEEWVLLEAKWLKNWGIIWKDTFKSSSWWRTIMETIDGEHWMIVFSAHRDRMYNASKRGSTFSRLNINIIVVKYGGNDGENGYIYIYRMVWPYFLPLFCGISVVFFLKYFHKFFFSNFIYNIILHSFILN